MDNKWTTMNGHNTTQHRDMLYDTQIVYGVLGT